MDNDEILAHVQAECIHEWQYTPGVGRQCQKCSLLWEVWAERRMRALEQRFSEEFEDDDNSVAFFWTLLPPQTRHTCPHCNGTGQRAFGDCIAICQVCHMTYDQPEISEYTNTDLLPCGHAKSAILYSAECGICHGTGVKPHGAQTDKAN